MLARLHHERCNRMKGLLIICALGLSGCQGLTDFVNALPPLTPEDQCGLSGGKWHQITIYDAARNVTGYSGECV